MVDSKKMEFNPAVEISYLNEEMQRELYDVIGMEQATPSLSQAQRIKKYFQEGKLNRIILETIMEEEKLQSVQWNIKPKNIKEYFPEDTKPEEMEKVIIKLLKDWAVKQKQKKRGDMYR